MRWYDIPTIVGQAMDRGSRNDPTRRMRHVERTASERLGIARSEHIDLQGVPEYWNTGSSGTKSEGIDEMAFSFGMAFQMTNIPKVRR